MGNVYKDELAYNDLRVLVKRLRLRGAKAPSMERIPGAPSIPMYTAKAEGIHIDFYKVLLNWMKEARRPVSARKRKQPAAKFPLPGATAPSSQQLDEGSINGNPSSDLTGP